MQEREKEQYDWKVSKPTQHRTRNSHQRERERARKQWEWVVSINNLCPKHHRHQQQRRSIACSIGLKRHWNTTMREREQRAQFQSWRIDEHKWEYEREREPIKCVCMMEELTSYHTTRRTTTRRRLCWCCCCCCWCLSEELRVRTWTPSKVGLQPRRSMSMSMSHTHCVLGWEGHDWVRERELAVS